MNDDKKFQQYRLRVAIVEWILAGLAILGFVVFK